MISSSAPVRETTLAEETLAKLLTVPASRIHSTLMEVLPTRAFRVEVEDKDVFAYSTMRDAFKTKEARQLNVGVIGSRLITAICEYEEAFNKNPITLDLSRNANKETIAYEVNAYHANQSEDFSLLRRYVALIDYRTGESQRIQVNTFPTITFALWHALDQAERNHEKRYAVKVKKIVPLLSIRDKKRIRDLFNDSLGKLEKIYQIKKELEQIKPVGLYVYRLRQFFPHYDKTVVLKHHVTMTESVCNDFKGFDAAGTKAYSNQFRKVLLGYQLKHSSAFKTITDMNSLLQMEVSPDFSTTFTQEVPKVVQEHIVGWLMKSIEGVTQSMTEVAVKSDFKNTFANKVGATEEDYQKYIVFSQELAEDHFMRFAIKVLNEQNLIDAMNDAHAIVVDIQKRTQSLDAVLAISTDNFAQRQIAPASAPSHDEVVARDKQRLKEIEQKEREERALEALKARRHSFDQKIKKENEEKKVEAQLAKKDELLGKIKLLSHAQTKQLIAFINPENPAHNQYNERETIDLLSKMDLIQETASGFKTSNQFEITSTHRAHDTMLDANFVKSMRQLFTELGIGIDQLEVRPLAKSLGLG